ncbi:MAG TPA: class II aldolase/adducin family protein [Gammaproteobacteria bacterium]|nr:class II aldolase/adducin family protein [Gammaproteobacteria bacterium]
MDVQDHGHGGCPARAVAPGASRRRLLRSTLGLFGLVLAGTQWSAVGQQQRGGAAGSDGSGSAGSTGPGGPDVPALPEFLRVVAANRILANEGVVDAFGHVSVRDPRDAERFVMSRSRSPALVELSDLMEFRLDGSPVDPRGRTVYGERMIHAAVYAARPDVHAVVHNHSRAVLPFALTGAPLEPVIHTASIIGPEIPVWDIRDRFGDTDMLVRTIEQGRDLAAALGSNTCALMRGHGAVVVGSSVQAAVLTAVYLQVDAEVLLAARGLGEPKGLSRGEIEKSSETQLSPLALDRAWEYFCARAGVDPV